MDASGVAIVSFVIAGAFVGGMNFAGSDPFPEFVPKFGDGENESHKCYLIAEVRETRLAYAGCYSMQRLSEWRDSWKAMELAWPFKIVAEYDRELDPLDLDARY